MEERIAQELDLLRKYYPNLQYVEAGRWVLLPAYPLPPGWNRENTDVAFQIKDGYPGTPPYGFFVQAGIQHKGKPPGEYKDGVSPKPLFEGEWGMFSWSHNETWRPTNDVRTGANLLHWARSFSERFSQGV